MHTILTLASALLAAGSAYAQTTHEVMTTPDLAFEPNTLSDVAEGDTIRVTFSTGVPHNILSGSWDSPCAYSEDGGVNSNVHQNGEVFLFTVNSTDPQVYFCSVGMHCQAGMALAVNPSGDDTVEAYQEGSSSASTMGPADDAAISGGMLEEEGAEGDDMSATTDESASTTSMPTSSETGDSESMSTTGTDATTGTMAPTTSGMPMETAAGGAAGFKSGVAMVGAFVAGGVALAI